ncbi:hypothetical protein ACSSS7_006694 [Eimeria intestinalis]
MLHRESEFAEPRRRALQAATLRAVIADVLERLMVRLEGPDDGRCFELGGRPSFLAVVQGARGVGNGTRATLVGLEEYRAEAVARAIAIKVEGPVALWVNDNGFGTKGLAEGAPGGFSFKCPGEVASTGGCLEERRRDDTEGALDLRWARLDAVSPDGVAQVGDRLGTGTTLRGMHLEVGRAKGGEELAEVGGETEREMAILPLAVWGDEAGLRAVFFGNPDLVKSLAHVEDREIALAIERGEIVVGAGKRSLRDADVLADGPIVAGQAPEKGGGAESK